MCRHFRFCCVVFATKPRSEVWTSGDRSAGRVLGLWTRLECSRLSRSFRRLADSFGHLVRAMGHDVGVWPPVAWTEVD